MPKGNGDLGAGLRSPGLRLLASGLPASGFWPPVSRPPASGLRLPASGLPVLLGLTAHIVALV